MRVSNKGLYPKRKPPLFRGGHYWGNIMINKAQFGFYKINIDYLKYLNEHDSEVYYNFKYKKDLKPFIGIILLVNEFEYFIPLSSAKEKHKKWKNVSNEHMLIYEIINNEKIKSFDIFKDFSKTQKLHILGVIDIKKMIPVPKGMYEKVLFNSLEESYKVLMNKEFKFCLKNRDKIQKNVEKIYMKQKERNIIGYATCNFSKLEQAMLKWNKVE